MKLLIYSDVHVSPYGEFSKPSPNYYTPRMGHLLNTASWIAERIISEKPDFVINAGDFFNSAHQLDPLSIYTGCEFISRVSDACSSVKAQHIIIYGNHDSIADSVHCLHPFKIQATVVEDAKQIDDILFISNTRNLDNVREVFKKHGTARYAVVHQDIKNGWMNAGIKSSGGLDESYFGDNIERVYSGHYHHPQQVGRITVVGSVMHHNFNDDFKIDRGIVVADDTKYELIKNPCSPLYRKVDIDDLYKLQSCITSEKADEEVYYWIRCSSSIKRDVMDKLSGEGNIRITEIPEDSTVKVIESDHRTDPYEALREKVDRDINIIQDLDKEKVLSIGKSIINSSGN